MSYLAFVNHETGFPLENVSFGERFMIWVDRGGLYLLKVGKLWIPNSGAPNISGISF